MRAFRRLPLVSLIALSAASWTLPSEAKPASKKGGEITTSEDAVADEAANVTLEDEPDEAPQKTLRRAPKAKPVDDDDEGGHDDKVESEDENEKKEDPEERPKNERPATSERRTVWLSAGFLQDLTFVSGDDVCDQHQQVSASYTCVRRSGSQYHGTPIAGSGGKLAGVTLGPTRVSLGLDVALLDRVSVGLRAAYAVLGQGPDPDGGKSFLPVHAEVRGAYWLLGKAMSTEGFGAFLELSGGVAQTAGHKDVTIQENMAVPPPSNQIDNPPQQSVTAYQSFGTGFAGGGAGVFLPFGSRGAVSADLRFSAFFPTSGFVMGLGINGALGL